MGRRLPSLTSLRAFEAAARHKSFTLAADEPSVTQGAISRQIKHLETYLKIALFERGTHSVELTTTAKVYHDSARNALDLMEQATARIVGGDRGNVLTLNVLPTLAIRWLIPKLARSNEPYPDIEIRMVTSIKPVRFDSDLDLALRVGDPFAESHPGDGEEAHGARIDLIMAEDYSGIEVEKLMPDTLVPVCAPHLFKCEPTTPNSLESLREYPLLHMINRRTARQDWLADTPLRDDSLIIDSKYGHFFMVIDAAIRGRGIACVPKVLVEEELADGRLIIPIAREVDSAGGYHMLYRRSRKHSRPLSDLRQWLKSAASAAP